MKKKRIFHIIVPITVFIIAFIVLDIILVINIILYGSDDECELILSDLNNDANIDVLDIVLIINLILE